MESQFTSLGPCQNLFLAKANIWCEFASYKVGKTENVENKLIRLERVASDLCKRNQRWSRGNVEECKLFRNFNSIHTINHNFPKRQVSQTPYLYNRRSVIEDENILFYVRMHRKRLKLNGTQQRSQVVRNMTYPTNHCIQHIITKSFTGHHFYNWRYESTKITLLPVECTGDKPLKFPGFLHYQRSRSRML